MPYKYKTRARTRNSTRKRSEKRARAAHRSRLRVFLDEQKSKPCADCGVQYPPYVMEFDHLPGHEKSFCVSNARKMNCSISHKRLLDEIAKCELVCANCHRERTFQRKQHRPSEETTREAPRPAGGQMRLFA